MNQQYLFITSTNKRRHDWKI